MNEQNPPINNNYSHHNRNRHAVAQWLQQIHFHYPKYHHHTSLPLIWHSQLHKYHNQKKSPQTIPQIHVNIVTVYVFQFLIQMQKKIPFPMMNVNIRNNSLSPNIHSNFNDPAYLQPQSQTRLEQLWEKNQHFMQSLKDYSQNVICYAYAQSNYSRVNLPKCLIGYYQLVKNIVYMSSYLNSTQIKNQPQIIMKQSKNKSKQSRTQTQSHSQQQPQKKFPKQLQLYSQQNLLRILLTYSPLNYIHQNLTKLQDTILTQTFRKQLQNLIIKRFQYLCQLFCLGIGQRDRDGIGRYFMCGLFDKMNGIGQIGQVSIEISIDLIILCIIYAVYRIRRYLILFAQIVQVYEKQTQNTVNKQELLQFYNNIFLIRLQPNTILHRIRIQESQTNTNQNRFINLQKETQILIKNQKMDQQENNMSNSGLKGSNIFRYQQLKQEKSIYDMFQ